MVIPHPIASKVDHTLDDGQRGFWGDWAEMVSGNEPGQNDPQAAWKRDRAVRGLAIIERVIGYRTS